MNKDTKEEIKKGVFVVELGIETWNLEERARKSISSEFTWFLFLEEISYESQDNEMSLEFSHSKFVW